MFVALSFEYGGYKFKMVGPDGRGGIEKKH